ncbi:MAG TPA: cohesin domain-containing protein [Candidatus Paceibacterota bacterium]|nr:cohesin domain-containing protein [Candidatus Paceibacterota bacterium]
MKIYSIFATVALFIPAVASAATLSFDPPHAHVKAGDAISFSVMLSADDSINAVGTAVQVPAGLSFISSSKGNVFTQWVETPSFDAKTSTVEFSGIMTGGWTGKDQVLATITLKAQQDGDYTLVYDPSQTELYKNDGKATPDTVTFGTIATPLAGRVLLGLVAAFAAVLLFFLLLRRKVMVRFV